MNTAQAPFEDKLPRSLVPGRLISLRGAQACCVRVESGRLWLTEAGDEDDHFLAAGDTHMLKGRGLVVLQCDSTEPALLQWSAVRPPSPHYRAGVGSWITHWRRAARTAFGYSGRPRLPL